MATTDSGALVFLEEYRKSPYSAADADAYVRKVMKSEYGEVIDTILTYEQLLLNQCEDKSSMKPWHGGLVPRAVSIGTALTPIFDATKTQMAIVLYGSRGCGKSVALNAVAEYVIKHHFFPNVVHLRLTWENEDDLTKKCRETTAEWTRNCLVAERLLRAVDSLVGRTIANEIERSAPLPDPTKFALVVTLDETENVPTSARALVSISRKLNGDRKNVPPAVETLRKVFDHVVILLAGNYRGDDDGVGGSDPSMACSVNLDTLDGVGAWKKKRRRRKPSVTSGDLFVKK